MSVQTRAIERTARGTVGEIEKRIEMGVREFRKLVDEMRRQVMLAVVEQGRLDPSDVAVIRDATTRITQAFQDRMIQQMSEDARRVFVRGILQVDRSLEAGGIRVALPYLSEETLNRARQFQADLVTNLTEFARNRVKQEVQLAVLGQKPNDEVVRDIGTALEGDRSVFATVWQRANIIYNTEMARISNLAAAERFEQAQRQIPDLKKRWQHSHLGTPRVNHLAMDGTVVPADGTFTLKGLDGNTYEVKAPHDPILPPGEAINCKCTIVPVVGRFSGEPVKPRKPKPPAIKPPVKPPPAPPPAMPPPVIKPTPPPATPSGEFTRGVYDTSSIQPEKFEKIVGKNAMPDQFWLAFRDTPARTFTYKPNAGNAYYRPWDKTVNFATKRPGIASDADRSWWKKKLASHEWGHALHYDRGFVTENGVDAEWRAVVDILKQEFIAFKNDTSHPMYQTFNPNAFVDYRKAAKDWLGADLDGYSLFQIGEFVNMTADCISAITSGQWAWGHKRSYWLSKDTHGYMEIFAHINTAIATIEGNPVLRRLFPRFYMAATSLLQRKMNEWAALTLQSQQSMATLEQELAAQNKGG